ncbi:hypothetical protein [Alysiella crassa]|nr:hypothetical protein [Alysiella crassa]
MVGIFVFGLRRRVRTTHRMTHKIGAWYAPYVNFIVYHQAA